MEHETVKDALAKIFAGIKQLRETFPCKKFTIDGRLVGDLGEVIVQRDYDVKLHPGSPKKYDGITSDGREVQIKATFKDSLTFTKTPDYYIGIKINEDGSYKEIFNGPGKLIEERYPNRGNSNNPTFSIRNTVLEELSPKDSMQKIPRRLR